MNEDTLTGKSVKIEYLMKDQVFNYSGVITSHDSDFIHLNEIRKGELVLNKKFILKMTF